jgi:hypothetical protein
MTQEDKNLLLQDLCSRLPHRVIVRCDKYKNMPDVPCFHCTGDGKFKLYADELPIEVEYIKPYLRPMRSMTEDEIKELGEIDMKRVIFSSRHLTYWIDGEIINYFLTHHIDFRGLIGKGLAIEVTKTNNPYETENSK